MASEVVKNESHGNRWNGRRTSPGKSII
jgi:hypothetical protein